MIDIPKGHGPGTWSEFIVDEYDPAKRRWAAVLHCPECNDPLLVSLHKIDADGTATPSVGHPEVLGERRRKRGLSPCTWHPPQVRFVGWQQLGPVPPLPAPSTCDDCHGVSYSLGGWTRCAWGLICPACWKARTAVPA